MGRIENPDLNDYGASLGWHGTSSIRAKWRSLSSARASTLKKDLTQSGIVREAMFRQQSEGSPITFDSLRYTKHLPILMFPFMRV
jgi:hypothetical protein